MTIKVNMYCQEGDDMAITLAVEHNSQTFLITKTVSVSEGKTKEQYVSDAYAAALDEINAWKDDVETVGKEFNPSTGSFE